MANLTIENRDNAGLCIGNELFEDALFTFAGADDFIEGAIIAKKKVASGAVAAKAGITGDGTCTEFALASGAIAKVGSYKVACTVAGLAHGGTFEVTDPNGALVGTFVMPNGAGGVYVFEGDGITFKLTDGGTNFAIGDFFTMAVAAVNKYVIYDIAGIGGAEFPVSVLAYPLSKAAGGDIAFRNLMRGDVRKGKLSVDGGSAVGVFELEQLKLNGIYAIATSEKNVLDNQ